MRSDKGSKTKRPKPAYPKGPKAQLRRNSLFGRGLPPPDALDIYGKKRIKDLIRKGAKKKMRKK